MPSNYRFTPAVIERIRELTAANEHELALWYAARHLGLKELEHEAATHYCRYSLVGELRPDLHKASWRIRNRLHAEMSESELIAFRGVT